MISREVWVDIKSLRQQGRSIRSIARQLGISRATVRRYLRSPEPPRYVRRAKPSILDPYKDYLAARLAEVPELHATVLLREIRAQGYAGEITLVKDFIRPLRSERRRLKELTVRYETAPGEQMQVDWSEFHRLPDEQKLYAFGAVLSWSRMQFVYFTTRMTVQELLTGLVLAFEYFGGWTGKILFDNPKTVVLRRGASVRSSTLHPRFQDFLGHYGLQLQLCEPRRPQTKGKIERPFSYVAASLVLPERGRHDTAHAWNTVGRRWLDTVANVRIHGTTGERPIDRLPREGLIPLQSVRPYDLTWTEARRVSRDGRVSWEGNLYSVPWEHGSTSVLVRRVPTGQLEIVRGGITIAVHQERSDRGQVVVLPEHVAGLWQRTLGRKQAYSPPPAVARMLPHTELLPTLAVERRDLSLYDAFLTEAGR